MTLKPGSNLGPYEIISLLGSGGMGEVYKAKDLKLGRTVAIKLLQKDLAADPERLKRFEQEARAASALDHPNIVTIFDISEADGQHFIVMQYVEGKTLRELIGKLKLSKTLHYAIQIADGLSRAHNHGIVHRDLKPDNLMVTEDGLVKILDFGLAKLTERSDWTEASTRDLAQPHTKEGHIVGTAPYMSPEQAQGKKVDARSDIFSFGSVLYEMVTGQRAFSANSMPELLTAIIRDEPRKVGDIVPSISVELERAITRALKKEPERRFQSMADVRVEFQEIKEELDSGSMISAERRPGARRSGKTWLRVAGALALLLVAGIVWYLAQPSEPKSMRLTNPVQVTSAIGVEDYPTWSPDGQTLAYAATQTGDMYGGNWDIWVAQVGGTQAVNRTEGHTAEDRYPNWSPDGKEIAFSSNRGDRGIFVMSALGGAPRKVSTSIGCRTTQWMTTPQWSRDTIRLAYRVCEGNEENFMEIISLSTGEAQRIPVPGQRRLRFDLSWSPDERFVAYVDADGMGNEVTRLMVLRISDGEAFEVTDGRTNVWSPSWSPDGRNLYFVSNRGGSMDLWSQPMGEDGRPVGDPIPVSTGLVIRSAAFSLDGTKLAYSKGRRVANLWRVPILADRPATWSDAEQLTFDQALTEFADVSPDGKQLLFSSDRSGNQDLWVMPVEDGEARQLTTDPTPDWCPMWSPDGQEIAFYSYRSGNRDIWTMPVSGGPARQVTQHENQDYFPAWSSDGRELAFASLRSGNWQVWVISAEGGEAQQLTDHPQGAHRPKWSPDGGWLAFVSSKLWRVPRGGGEPEQISENVARTPTFSPDGKWIYFNDAAENLWELSLEDGSERPVAKLADKRGHVVGNALATDGKHVYFSWFEEIGDIWVMDVVYE